MKHAVNTESLILAHLIANPGQTPAQIAHAIGRTYITVKSTLKIMLANCDVWNDGYSLHFAVEADGIAEPEYLRLAKLAEELQSRNCWYRAGQAWAQARNSTSLPACKKKPSISISAAWNRATSERPSQSLTRFLAGVTADESD